jgi:CheY-like chemotaxis protein
MSERGETWTDAGEALGPGRYTVLLADDDEAVRRMTARALRGIGLRVLEACDGREALDLFNAAPDAVDLVLTDVCMPRLSGRALAFALAHLRPNLPVLFITGYPEDQDVRALQADSATVLGKPFTLGQLVAATVEALRAGRAAR